MQNYNNLDFRGGYNHRRLKKKNFFLIKHQSIFNEINLYSISYILFMNSVHANTVKKSFNKKQNM